MIFRREIDLFTLNPALFGSCEEMLKNIHPHFVLTICLEMKLFNFCPGKKKQRFLKCEIIFFVFLGNKIFNPKKFVLNLFLTKLTSLL